MSPQETAAAQARIDTEAKANAPGNLPEMSFAGVHALQRGVGESVGVPVDSAAIGIAGLFGDRAKRGTREYLKGLDERYPTLTKITGVEGNVAGAIGAAAALKAPGGIGAPAMRGVGGVAARAAYGGAENVVQATTRDVNESALGDHPINAEKLVAAAPERFLFGAVVTGGFEGAAAGLGAGARAVRGRAVPALEAGAARAIGREVGETGADETLVAGNRIRALAGGEIPKSREALGGLLAAEQGAQRGQRSAGLISALEGEQTLEGVRLGTAQAFERRAAAGAGERGIAQAEKAGAEGELEAMARGGKAVEEAELKGAGRRATAEAESFDRYGEAIASGERTGNQALREELSAAQAPVRQVEEHYGTLRQALAQEHAEAKGLADALKAQRLEVVEKFGDALNRAEAAAGIKNAESKAAAAVEVKATRDAAAAEAQAGRVRMEAAREGIPRDPTKEAMIAWHQAPHPKPPKPYPPVGGMSGAIREASEEFHQWSSVSQGKTGKWKGNRWIEDATTEAQTEATMAQRAETATATATASTSQEVKRYQSLSDQLRLAHEDSLKSVAEIEAAIGQNEAKAARDVAASTRAAEARFLSYKNQSEAAAYAAGTKSATATEKAGKVATETEAAIEQARVGAGPEVRKAQAATTAKVEAAKGSAEKAGAAFETKAAAERGKLGTAHEKQAGKLPKLSEIATDVDPYIAGMANRANTEAARPAIGTNAMWHAGFALVHGHPISAAAALVGSFLVGKARAQGNLGAARMMHALADRITEVDRAIHSGTALILGGQVSREAANDVDKALGKEPKKAPSFAAISKDINEVQGNPSILDQRVQMALGDAVGTAPQTYAETLASAARTHAFLYSVLPRPQKDPYSLTPRLDNGVVSPSEQYEFMQAYRTTLSPMSIYNDTRNGTVSEIQVQALEASYPQIYKQMRDEVARQTQDLSSPVSYERAIQVGTLFGVPTDEVLDPDFQKSIAKAYEEKESSGQTAGGSRASPGNGSAVTKSMISGSQGVEGGVR